MRYHYEILKEGDPSVAIAAQEDSVVPLIDTGHVMPGYQDLHEKYGDLSTVEQDLLLLGASILAVDRGSARGEREQFNRRMVLDIHLHNVDRYFPLMQDFIRILRLLSNDSWTINLHQTRAVPRWGQRPEHACVQSEKKGSVLLFSGGLDSLAAAVEFGAKGALHLVSHVTRNTVTDTAQKKLAELLEKKKLLVDHTQVFVSSRNADSATFVHDVEPTQRTRSVVFLIIAAIVARREGFHKVIYLAENGQMAIHLPLTGGRIGAFSTHTAHPSVLVRMERFLSRALDFEFKLTNPYLYLTKAEVVSRIAKVFPKGIPLSTSCWRNARAARSGVYHCGDCVPCITRRIAVEANGKDATRYARDIFNEDITRLSDDDDGRRNVADVAEFILRLRTTSNDDLLQEFPDLISEDFDDVQAIEMYKRFGREAYTVLSRYPRLRSILT